MKTCNIIFFIICMILCIWYVCLYAKCINRGKSSTERLTCTLLFLGSLPGIMYLLLNVFGGSVLEGIIGEEGFWSRMYDGTLEHLFYTVFPNTSIHSNSGDWFVLIVGSFIPLIMAMFAGICGGLILLYYKELESPQELESIQQLESAWLQALFYYFSLENVKNICK